MNLTEKKFAFAALDIGTSQIKLGVYCPSISPGILLVNNLENELIYGTSGEVSSDYMVVREKCFILLRELGVLLKKHGVGTLNLGICGHISSLIEWNRATGLPPAKPFPTWLDTTSFKSLDEYNHVMGDGKSREIIGTFLPAGTNWLLTKLLHRKSSGFSKNAVFLQIGDAVFFELCGRYQTHFSSQLSMVDLKKKQYAPELINYLELDATSLPSIDNQRCAMIENKRALFDLPEETFVFPAMADLYTSLYALRLQDREGFMLANTSEQAGAFYDEKPTAPDNFLSISFSQGYINYGSTNTGGNIVNWFLKNVLNKNPSSGLLDELTTKAAAIEPGNTPVILPYLQGERAPLWNNMLTASIHELRSSHTDVHLFRAILESIAFARKQCFEQLGINDLHVIKLGGGSSKNNLWNLIRATVINKRIAVADEKELSMAGIIDYLIEASASSLAKPAINFSMIHPQPGYLEVYEDKYQNFLRYQKMLT